MELIVIDPTRLKIMLTEPDMRRYDLSCGTLDCTDEETRRTFRRIIEDARLRSGFDTAGQQLFVQLFTSKDGGCEIFVTKLGEAEGSGAPHITLSGPEQALLRRVYAVQPGSPSRSASPDVPLPCPAARSAGRIGERIGGRLAAVLFDGTEPMVAACRRLSGVGYGGGSRAYLAEDGHCCLILHVPDVPFARLPRELAFLCEYGEPADGRVMEVYLCEHGRVLCGEDAVQVLGRL